MIDWLFIIIYLVLSFIIGLNKISYYAWAILHTIVVIICIIIGAYSEPLGDTNFIELAIYAIAGYLGVELANIGKQKWD